MRARMLKALMVEGYSVENVEREVKVAYAVFHLRNEWWSAEGLRTF